MGSKRTLGDVTAVPHRSKKKCNKSIKSFWDQHYISDQTSKNLKKIRVNEVHSFFLQTEPYADLNLNEFKCLNGRHTSVKLKKDRTGGKFYYVYPISDSACAFHGIEYEPLSTESPSGVCSFNLANIQGLITNKRNKCKFVDLATSSESSQSRIIALTESHLSSSKQFDAEILKQFKNYNIIRADRDTEFDQNDEFQLLSRGGCLLMTSPEIITIPKTTFSNGNCELIIAECPEMETSVIILYRPPKPNFSLPKFKEIIDKIRKYLTGRDANDISYTTTVAGDFNFPDRIVEWIPSNDGVFAVAKEGVTDEKMAFQILQELAIDFGLEQLVDKPTRENAILDLVFTDCPASYSNCTVKSLKPMSDHNLVTFERNIKLTTTEKTTAESPLQPETSKYDFKNADQDEMARALQTTDWDTVLGDLNNIESTNERFANAIVSAAKEARVPIFKSRSRIRMDRKLENLVREKNKLEAQITHGRITNTDEAAKSTRITEINQEIQQCIDTKKQQDETKVINEIKNNPKAFFKYANSNKESRMKIGPLKSGVTFESGPKKMADILSNQYQGVFSTPCVNTSAIQMKEYLFDHLLDIDITEEQIREAVKSMNASSASGPDGIPAFLFKDYIDQLLYPILKIWRTSLDTGNLPEGTALAVITPIFKGGVRSAPANYRPVSLTNHLTKIFERVLRKALVKHLEINGVMNPTQHGFRAGRSTISQLLRYYDDILSKLEEGGEVDAIYLDFAKAFDKVDHNILLKKISCLNIGGKIIRWIESFLKKRNQIVKVDGHYSDPVKVKSGVPQGSVLGPLFFLILMIDIDAEITRAVLGSFADDTRIWHKVESFLNTSELQEDLLKVYQWAEVNNMNFNADKFELMTFSSTGRTPLYVTPTGEPIGRKEVIKDLGIQMEDDLSFQTHIATTAAKGHRMAGWSLRTFKSRGRDLMITLLKSLIVCHVEYGCVVWSPTEQNQINLLESVQRRFTSRMACFQTYDEELDMPVCTTDYPLRLKQLNIYSLQRRRERYIIIYIYKIIIHLIENPGLTINYNPRTKLMIHPKSCNQAPAWIKKARSSSFFAQGPKLFNALPSHLRELEDIADPAKSHVHSFKGRLDDHLRGIPDNPGTQANSLCPTHK